MSNHHYIDETQEYEIDELRKLVRELTSLTKALKALLEGFTINFSPQITFIANSGEGDVAIGSNQDNDQANTVEIDQANKQLGADNVSTTSSNTSASG